jgi:tRNA nucleotidyltransferase (CCA-adding enzyme)
MSDGDTVLERLREQPGGIELAELASKGDEVALVGGAVRDLLLARTPRELDVVVADGTERLAGELAARLGQAGLSPDEAPRLTVHERFGTAVVEWPGGRIDVARRRAESYPDPGALPQVRPGSVEEDLARRDFTVNAIAVPLAGPHAGELAEAEHAGEDLDAGRLRVLHDLSFIDDPTRLFRLARYRARLCFEIEPRTARLASEALAAGALATVSGTRLGAELRLALAEPDALGALQSHAELGLLAPLGLGDTIDTDLARRALELLPDDGAPQELLLAVLVFSGAGAAGDRDRAELRQTLDRLEFAAGERERALDAAFGVRALAARMARAEHPSQLHDALAEQTAEAIALAAALGEQMLAGGASPGGGAATPAEQAGLWFDELRHVRLAITGDDLLAAGLAPGPEIGMRLKAALACKLDGELAEDGAGAELRAALEATP